MTFNHVVADDLAVKKSHLIYSKQSLHYLSLAQHRTSSQINARRHNIYICRIQLANWQESTSSLSSGVTMTVSVTVIARQH